MSAQNPFTVRKGHILTRSWTITVGLVEIENISVDSGPEVANNNKNISISEYKCSNGLC